ncbi:MAG: sugar transporter, partial [Chlamydiota bacterium]
MKGAAEFVMDSHKIRQGKFAILQMEGAPLECLDPSSFEEYIDVIDENDILQILIYHPMRSDLVEAVGAIGRTVGYRVIEGYVYLPQLPPVRVAGLTLLQAKEALQGAYDEQIREIEVFVDYRERLTRTVDLIGPVAVRSMPVDGRIRLFEVLSRAGVSPSANLFMSYVLRCGKILRVDMAQLIKEGDMCQNIVMRPRDKIYIAEPSDSKVMIMGEVGHPRAVYLPKGSISLREALVEAGGIPFTGDKSCIQVIRGGIVCPKVYLLDWNHIITLPNHSLLLMPGDTVY